MHNIFVPSRANAYEDAKERLKSETQYTPANQAAATVLDQQKADVQQWYQETQKDEASAQYASSLVGVSATRLQESLLQGGGAATNRAAIPGIEKSIQGGIASLDNEITRNKKGAAAFPGEKAFYDEQIAEDQQKQEQLRLVPLTLARAGLTTQIDEQDASFGATQATSQNAITRGLLSGKPLADLAPQFDQIFTGQEQRASDLAQDSRNPLLSPAERSRLSAQGAQIDTAAYQQHNEYVYGGIQEGLRDTGLARARADQSYQAVQLTGTPDDVFKAASERVRSLTDEFDKLTTALRRTDLTNAQRQELTGRRDADAAQIKVDAILDPREKIEQQRGIANTDLDRDTVGLPRQIRIGGSASVDDRQVDQDYSGILKADQDYIGQFAPGTLF